MPGLGDVIGQLTPEERQRLLLAQLGGASAGAAQLMGRPGVGIGQLLLAIGGGVTQGTSGYLGDVESQRERQEILGLRRDQLTAEKEETEAKVQARRQRAAAINDLATQFDQTDPSKAKLLRAFGDEAAGPMIKSMFPEQGSPQIVGGETGGYYRYDPSTGKTEQIRPGIGWKPESREPSDSFEVLSPEDTKRLGFAEGSVVERSRRSGNLQMVQSPRSGMELTTTDSQGNPVTVRVGGQGTSAPGNLGLTKPTENRIQDETVSLLDQQARVARIGQLWRPEFQQLGTRLGNAWSAGKERLGVELSEGERKQLEDFTYAKSAAATDMNRMIKEQAGTAMTTAEADRILQEVPNPGTGVLDGDSPTQFKSKLDARTREIRLALARKIHLLRNGIPHDFARGETGGVGIDDVPALIDRRGEEIEAELKAQGLPQAEAEARAAQRLRQEFGL